MKKIFVQSLLVLLISSVGLLACRASKVNGKIQYSVSGKVITNKVYCGGAAPTKEMLENLKMPILYAGKTFYIKKQSENYVGKEILLSFTSNSFGEFKIQLSPGKYAFFLDEQINEINFKEEKNINLNQSCYKDWLQKPFFELEVKKESINDLLFTIPKKCFINFDIPCLEFTGPRPQ